MFSLAPFFIAAASFVKGFDDPAVISRSIRMKSARYDLREDIVAAVIYQESSGNPWANRYEKGFYRRYIQHLTRETLPGHVPRWGVTLDTEKYSRAVSWGLMQIMGETARENGYKARYLPKLIKTNDNLEIGCRYLRSLLNLYPNESNPELRYRKALLRYNGGGDPDYPNKIFKHISSGAYKRVLTEI